MKLKRIGAVALLGASITFSPTNIFAKKPPLVDRYSAWDILSIVYSGVKTRSLAEKIKPYLIYYNIPVYIDSIPKIAQERVKISLQLINALNSDKVDDKIEDMIINNLKNNNEIDLIMDFIFYWKGRNKLINVAEFIKQKNDKTENDYLIYSLITNKYLEGTPKNVKEKLEYITINPKKYLEDGTLIVAQVFDSKSWFENSIKSFKKCASQFGKVKETKRNEDGWEIVTLTTNKLRMEFAYPKSVIDKRSYVRKAARYADIIAYRGDIIYQEQFIMPEDVNTGRNMIVWFGSCFSAPHIKEYKKITGNKIKYIANIGTGYGWANITGIEKLISEIIKNKNVLLFSDLELEDEMRKTVKDVVITYPSIN